MTSKLKCPFCGEEIVSIPNIAQTRTVGFRCYNIQCKAFNHFMPVFILEALIQAKQDLEIATKALEEYADEDMWENCCKWDIEYMQGLFLEHGYEIAKEALEQIEHKE